MSEQTMSREKQIEELTTELIKTNSYGTLNAVAEHLYNAGYRKQSEAEWIVLAEFSDRSICTECPICGEEYTYKKGQIGEHVKTFYAEYNFCPNCGAKMFVQNEIKDYPPYLDRPKMKGGAE